MNSALRERLTLAEGSFRSGDILFCERLLEQILSSAPSNAKANELMAYVAGQRGDWDRAFVLLKRCTSGSDASAEAWYYLGTIFLKRGQCDDALQAFRNSLTKAGKFFEGLHDLGLSLNKCGRYEEALRSYDEALSIQPKSAVAWSNRGVTLRHLRRYRESLESLDKALALAPGFADAWINRGVTLYRSGRYAEALESYRKASCLEPDSADIRIHEGTALCALRRFDEALASYGRALALDPTDANAQWNESLLRLTAGQLEAGFEKYESRWSRTEAEPLRHTHIPLWLGKESLQGRRILVWAEQGYGDTIQFCRYVPLLAGLGAEVIFEVPRPLETLMGSLGGCRIVAEGAEVPQVDCQIPLASLPLAFRTTLETIPSSPRYLKALASRVAAWAGRLGGERGRRRIGIACSGRETFPDNHNRSMPLSHFAPLQELGQLYVIQKELREEDRAFLARSGGMEFPGGSVVDFHDTAAIIENLDLVISIDTSVAHLAAALGKPVWILLCWAPDWRWLLDRADSPWYPSATLFRQERPGDWEGAMANVQKAMQPPPQ
jgi:tetratricopeptide (TPR) repeat protein